MEAENKKKVLQINAGSSYFGGVSAFLYNLVSNINSDEFAFDFLSPDKTTYSIVRDELEDCGCCIYELNIPGGGKKHFRLYLELKRFLTNHKYDIVHINSGVPIFNYICMKAAKRASVPSIIVHSHSDLPDGSWMKNRIVSYVRSRFGKDCKALLSCSQKAGVFMFGDTDFEVINNGINLEKFKFDIEKRNDVRNNAGICDSQIVIGFVGRLTRPKNPFFVIDVFNQIHLKMPNAVFWMVGDGELKAEVKNRIDNLGLTELIQLFGVRDDVDRLLQGMDALLMPSLYEGLGIVAIEAQTAGLLVFASDRLPIETKVSTHIIYESLSDTPQKWANMIMEQLNNCKNNRSFMQKEIEDYDIKAVSARVLEIYKGMTN